MLAVAVLARAARVFVLKGSRSGREFERRKINDDRHVAEWKGTVRAKHPVLGGLMLAVADEPKTTKPARGMSAPTGRKCSPHPWIG